MMRPRETMTPMFPPCYRYLMKRMAMARRYKGPGGATMVTLVLHASTVDEIHAQLVADMEAAAGSSTRETQP